MAQYFHHNRTRFLLVKIVFPLLWFVSVLIEIRLLVAPFHLLVISFPEFPIKAFDNPDIYNKFPLPNAARIIFSMVFYTLLVAMLATLPLYFKRRFENPYFYKEYKKFWWFGATVFLMLYQMLYGLTPYGRPVNENLLFYSLGYITIFGLTIWPAALQHSNKNKQAD